MIDFRIYRAGFLPALVAIVVLLFALQTPPPPLAPVVAPAEFDQDAAAKIARQIVAKAPDRTPGSSGDAAVADLVENRFGAVRDAQVAEQSFGGSFDGRDVGLRNLILTLPGQSPRSVVILASRDSRSGPGAASSAAATGVLLELVKELESSRHTKTLIFVSTDGASAGAAGAREFARSFPEPDLIDGTIVLWQPGSRTRSEPSLLATSDGPQSASAGLVRTGERALADQAATSPPADGTFGELARLAMPSGLGDQAPLIERGIPSIGLSSAGERPLPASADQPGDLSASTLGDFGRTALLLAVTLDAASAPPEHGPDAYVTLSGNLVPGWALSLLALTLLLPAVLAAVDALARARRRKMRVGPSLRWAVSRALPFLFPLLLLYFLALTGIVARPAFPFDPNAFGIGPGQIAAMAVLGAVLLAGGYALGAWRVPAGLPSEAAAPALGVSSGVAVFIAWLANPFLALLLVPTAHVWLLGGVGRRALPWPAVLGAAAISLVPSAAAIGDLIGRLQLGSSAPWQLLLMVGDGQIGLVTTLAGTLLAGCLTGIVAVAARGARPLPSGPAPTSPAPERAPRSAADPAGSPRAPARRPRGARRSGRIFYRA